MYVQAIETSELLDKGETLLFGRLGHSGGLPHVELYKGTGVRVLVDLGYFKKAFVAVDAATFEPQRKRLPLEDPRVRTAYLRAGASEAERIAMLISERDAFKSKLMESFVYMSVLADKVEVLRGGDRGQRYGDGKALAEDIRKFVRDGHRL